MRLLQILQFLLLPTFNVNVVKGNTLCASLNAGRTFEHDEQGCNFTVAASIHIECANFEDNVDFVKMFAGSTPGLSAPVCRIEFKNNKCSSAVGCVCRNDTGIFSVTKQMTSSFSEGLLLMGVLRDGYTFHTHVKLQPEDCATSSTYEPSGFPNTTTDLTPTPATVPSSSFVGTAFPDRSNYTSVTPKDPQQLIIILGSIGCGLLFLVGLSIVFNAVMRKRRVRGRPEILPPPPAPHCVRHAAGDDMMFCGQPPQLPGRHSLVNVHVNDYAEIPDDTDTSVSNKSQTTLDSSPVSDSSMSDDCLHHIACPSSDSSLPEDYLHPVAPASEGAVPATTTEASSSTKAGTHTGHRSVQGKKLTKKSRPSQT